MLLNSHPPYVMQVHMPKAQWSQALWSMGTVLKLQVLRHALTAHDTSEY